MSALLFNMVIDWVIRKTTEHAPRGIIWYITFTYLGSTVRNGGGAGNVIMKRLGKARNVFRTLNNVWKSSQYSKTTKIKLYQSCVLCYMDQNIGR